MLLCPVFSVQTLHEKTAGRLCSAFNHTGLGEQNTLATQQEKRNGNRERIPKSLLRPCSMRVISLQKQYLSALPPLILHPLRWVVTPPFAANKTFWCSYTEQLYTVKWQKAVTEVILRGVTIISCVFNHKGLTGWKTIKSCQVWILWCSILADTCQRARYFLCRILLSCFKL